MRLKLAFGTFNETNATECCKIVANKISKYGYI